MKIIKRVHKPKQRVISLEEYKNPKGVCNLHNPTEEAKRATAIIDKLVKEAESRSGKKGE